MTNRRKVVHVITRLDFGGAQQNTLWTVRHLNPEKYDVVLASGQGGKLDEDAHESLEKGICRVAFFSSLVREISPIRDLLAFFSLWRFFIAEKPDIVHTHSSKAGIIGRLAAWAAGVKIIVHTYHGFGFHDFQNPLVKKNYVLLERLCSHFTHALIFVSRSNWDYALKNGIGPESRFHLIRSGVDLSRFPVKVEDRALKKKELGFDSEALLVVSIGNLKPQKNPLDFVATAARVSEEIPQARFLFIGDGSLRFKAENFARELGVFKKIRFPGWRKDAAEWLAVADVFVLTSLWEGLPRALVEAMKSGLPCAAYAVDGISEMIRDGENGFIIPVKDVESLSKRVIDLLRDPELRRKMGLQAAKSIAEEFDINRMVQEQETLYAELLGD
jgi:glycosyltransferase involved in cell wall biosynthesis